MKILIKDATIIDKQSIHHHKTADVLIEDGIISKIGKINTSADHEINGKNLLLTVGFFDLHVNFREPGQEYKETLHSGCSAAAAGGFTEVLQMPSTNPVIQSKSEIELIRSKTKQELVEVHVAGALSENLQGKNLAEMYDMFLNGALCFTDDKNSVQDSGLMLRALQYSGTFHSLVMNFPHDHSLAGHGIMHEGLVNIGLGMKGIPSIAEETMIERDLKLCHYAESGIHFSTISTAGSVELIRQAKARGMKVTCDVAACNLLLDDSVLEDFDTNNKLLPPLRSKEDVIALKAGLKDDTIDAICSDHSPEDTENKKKEFELAAFGAEGCETAFAAAYTALKDDLPVEKILEKFTSGPRKILSLNIPKIEEGEKANLVLLDTSKNWIVTEESILSKSRNNPFLGRELTGKVKAVINKGKVFENKPVVIA